MTKKLVLCTEVREWSDTVIDGKAIPAGKAVNVLEFALDRKTGERAMLSLVRYRVGTEITVKQWAQFDVAQIYEVELTPELYRNLSTITSLVERKDIVMPSLRMEDHPVKMFKNEKL